MEVDAVAIYSTTVKMAACRAFCQKPWQKRMKPNCASPKEAKYMKIIVQSVNWSKYLDRM